MSHELQAHIPNTVFRNKELEMKRKMNVNNYKNRGEIACNNSRITTFLIKFIMKCIRMCCIVFSGFCNGFSQFVISSSDMQTKKKRCLWIKRFRCCEHCFTGPWHSSIAPWHISVRLSFDLKNNEHFKFTMLRFCKITENSWNLTIHTLASLHGLHCSNKGMMRDLYFYSYILLLNFG